MPQFVAVKSLAYMVTKITVHISVLKCWERKSGEITNNTETLRFKTVGNFLWLVCVEQKGM